MAESRRCPKCSLSFPLTLEHFHRNLGTSGGFEYYCKKCKNKVSKDRYDARRQAHLEQQKRAAASTRPVVNVPESPSVDIAPKTPSDDFHVEVAPLEETPEYKTREQLKIARLELQAQEARSRVRELEKLVLGGDAVRDLIGSLGLPDVTAPEWMAGASAPRSVHGTAVLVISDIHAGEVVRAEQVGGCNAYDMAVMKTRLQNTFRNAVKLLKGFMAKPSYDGIVAVLGGDLCSGNIHEELTETNEAPIQVVMLELEKILIEGLTGLVDEFGKMHVPCVTGNHGRMHKKPRAKNRAWENFEWMIYQRLKTHFAPDPRVTFDVPEGSDAYFSVYKHRFGLTHGDQFRGGDGVGGIMVPIGRGVSRKQIRDQAMGLGAADTWIIGHWHQYIHTRQLVVNGSTKGMDEWSFQMNFPYQPPEQACFVVHQELGVTFRMPVRCDRG